MSSGEYDYDYDCVSGGEDFGVWTDQGAIYDPVANSWMCIDPPTGWSQIGDAQSVVLPDGTFMLAHPFDNEVATLDASTNPPSFNPPLTPPGKSADSANDEEGWTLLPDGTVQTTEIYNALDGTETPALRYASPEDAWTADGIAPDPLVLIQKGDTEYYEIGPEILHPGGTVIAFGATGFNDIYNIKKRTWTHGPSFPAITDSDTDCALASPTQQLVMADALAALLPDGNVLVAASAVDANCGWIPPSVFFEFDGTGLTLVAQPLDAPDFPAYVGRLLVAPYRSGHV